MHFAFVDAFCSCDILRGPDGHWTRRHCCNEHHTTTNVDNFTTVIGPCELNNKLHLSISYSFVCSPYKYHHSHEPSLLPERKLSQTVPGVCDSRKSSEKFVAESMASLGADRPGLHPPGADTRLKLNWRWLKKRSAPGDTNPSDANTLKEVVRHCNIQLPWQLYGLEVYHVLWACLISVNQPNSRWIIYR